MLVAKLQKIAECLQRQAKREKAYTSPYMEIIF